MIAFIARFFIVALALLAAAHYIPGIHVESFYIALVVAVLLGLANLFIRPVLYILTLPITLLTFGLFALVLNAALFWFVATFVQGFGVDGFLAAFFGALLVSAARFLAEHIT